MKKLLLSILFLLLAITSQGQWLGDPNYTLTFDDTTAFVHLRIDSLTNQNNLWQVGAPQKVVFTNAFSSPNVVVTDTINPYPINDTSRFEILNIASDGWSMGFFVGIGGNYQVNSDTLSDFGTIEVSPNNGATWIDILRDTVYTNHFTPWTPKPVLSGNSNGWQHFFVELGLMGSIYNVQIGDTILFRLTFISDSIQTNKDGLMFDDFYFVDYFEAVQEVQNNNLISIFPNPSAQELFIQQKTKTDNQSIQVFDFNGRLVFENLNFTGQTIDTKQLTNGVYMLKYADTKNYSLKKFIVQH